MKRKFRTLLFLFSVFVIFQTPVFAETGNEDVCNPAKSWFAGNSNSFGNDIRKTTVNHMTSIVTDYSFKSATGAEIGQYMGCINNFKAQVPDMDLDNTMSCDNETAQEICESLTNQFAYATDPLAFDKFRKSPVAGSLLGISYSLENSITYQPIPVNMAYFFKHYAGKIPLVNQTAFAQSANYRPEELFRVLLDVWKVTRNLAFGLMSIIMLYVGIAIITRKQINQQTVVSIQYALPKIVIALVLITFSYPIGAGLTSIAWSLRNSAGSIVESLYSGLAGDSLGVKMLPSLGIIIGILAASFLGSLGAAVPIAATVLILGILTLVVVHIMVLIKTFVILFKMLVKIVSAPLEFAIYAIPGNESRLGDWFKQMAVYTLSLVALGGIPVLVHQVGASFLSADSAGWFGSALLTIFAPFFVYIFGFSLAVKMPEKIEAMIMGSKTGGKKR